MVFFSCFQRYFTKTSICPKDIPAIVSKETTTTIFNPFPTYRHFLTTLQQTAFEIIVACGEIVYNDQFLLLPQWFQLYNHTFIYRIFLIFAKIISKIYFMWERVQIFDMAWWGSNNGLPANTSTLRLILENVCLLFVLVNLPLFLLHLLLPSFCT